MMKIPQRFLSWAVVSLAALYILLHVGAVKDDGPYALQEFGRLPASAQGRVKPLDTVARNSLMIISDRQSFQLNGKRQPAIRWLVDVIARPEQAEEYAVFRIDHPDVLALMGLTHDDGKRFSFAKIKEHYDTISNQAHNAMQVKPKKRNLYQKNVLDLFAHIMLYTRLSRLETPYFVPPLFDGEQWEPLAQALSDVHHSVRRQAALKSFLSLLAAYQDTDPQRFNQQLNQYRQLLNDHIPQIITRADYEVFFNNFRPFYRAAILYVVVVLAGCLFFLGPSAGSHAQRQAAMWLLTTAFAVHTFGLASRIYLQGRPPVTNLYSSAIFIGWVCVLMGLIIERMFQLGLGSVIAAGIGFLGLIIAQNLGTDGDTMEMMQAVLDSNFWLATHVIAVTTGYAATFLAGSIAVLFIVLGVFTPALGTDMSKALVRMVYGVVCFATVFSFLGTVLGGIWADQSWGRFWGWDPKENGALLIVLMNVLILHARWGGMIRARGMMVLAIAGNIVTSWSWFGTNMLGIGLHAYGFMDGAMYWMALFIVSQLLLMGLGLLPMRLWRSFAHARRYSSAANSNQLMN